MYENYKLFLLKLTFQKSIIYKGKSKIKNATFQ